MPDPCPCGTQKKAIQPIVQYITQDILDAIQATSAQNINSLLDKSYGRAFNLLEVCAQAPPQPPPVSLDWFLDPLSHADEIWQTIIAVEWNTWCECTPCPPIAGCVGVNQFILGPGDGYCHDYETIGGVVVCVQKEYKLLGGATIYVERNSDHACYGPFNGLEVDWGINTTFDPTLPVNLNSYGGGTPTGWNGALHGQDMTVYVGDGGGGGPNWQWDNGTITVGDPPAPPACDPTSVCTAIDFVRDKVTRLETMVGVLGYAITGTSGDGTFPLPGTINNVSGTLIDILRQAVTALSPITPTQLTNSDTTPVATSGSVSVVGKQFVEIAFTAVDPSFGSRGTTAEVYYSAARWPGPGWVLVCSDYGVIEYHELKYPQNTQFALPPLATHLLIELNALVEVNVTTFERDVTL